MGILRAVWEPELPSALTQSHAGRGAEGGGKEYDEILIEKNRYGAMWLHFAVRPPSQENRRKIAFIKA